MSPISVNFVVFVAGAVASFYMLPRRYGWRVLLFFSLAMYMLCGLLELFCVLFVPIFTYIFSIIIDKNNQIKGVQARKRKKVVLVCGVIGIFSCLILFKFLLPVCDKTGIFGRKIPMYAMPLGLSFYTFSAVGYLIDVYRGKLDAEKDLLRLILFVSFFPQAFLGPIANYGEMSKTLFCGKKADNKTYIYAGIFRIAIGYFKKLVIADNIAPTVRRITDSHEDYGGIYIVILIVIYTLQIYCDFSGGCDIFLGIARLFGILLPENFNAPFLAENVRQYWKRWHISLGAWFENYVFMPLSISRPMQKLSRLSRKRLGINFGKRIPVYLSAFVTWFLTGIWHGVGTNFVAWGLVNCSFVLISQELSPIMAKWKMRERLHIPKKIYRSFAVLVTFFAVGSTRLFDLYGDALTAVRSFLGIFTSVGDIGNVIASLDLNFRVVAVVGICLACLLAFEISEQRYKEEFTRRHPVMSVWVIAALAVTTVIFGVYGYGYDANQFIYNRY